MFCCVGADRISTIAPQPSTSFGRTLVQSLVISNRESVPPNAASVRAALFLLGSPTYAYVVKRNSKQRLRRRKPNKSTRRVVHAVIIPTQKKIKLSTTKTEVDKVTPNVPTAVPPKPPSLPTPLYRTVHYRVPPQPRGMSRSQSVSTAMEAF